MQPIFVTTTIVQWTPVFSDIALAEHALNNLEAIRVGHNAIIFGFALMPDHLHMLIQTEKKGQLSVIMKKWKSYTVKYIIEYCQDNNNEWLAIFEGNTKKYNLPPFRKYQIWQPRFDEKAVRDEREFLAKLNYMHGNPIKHNLVDECGDYPYSSYADYIGGNNGYVTVQCGFQENQYGEKQGRGHNKLRHAGRGAVTASFWIPRSGAVTRGAVN